MQAFLQSNIGGGRDGALHHAYVLIGKGATVRLELFSFFKDSLGVTTVANPDFYHIVKDSFAIEDSRFVKDLHSSRPFGEGKRLIVIEMNFAQHEAQNALLKVLEEPHDGTHFFIIIPSSHILLPTVRSRVMIVDTSLAVESVPAELGEVDLFGAPVAIAEVPVSENSPGADFLNMSIKERIAYAADLAERVSDDETSKREAIDLLNDLEYALYNKKTVGKKELPVRRLSAIIRARDYLHDRSPSVKQLLEYVALSV